MGDFQDFPIPYVILPWTGREDGSDTGYRDVAVAETKGNSDDLQLVTGIVHTYPVYNLGAKPGICLAYQSGLGAPRQMVVRKPVNIALRRAATLLRSHGRGIVVLDAFRSAETQRRLFCYLFTHITEGRDPLKMSAADIVVAGKKADDIGSYVAVKDDTDAYRVAFLRGSYGGVPLGEIAEAAGVESAGEALKLLLAFGANLGFEPTLELDEDATTAHGSGGATDAILVDSNGKATCLGVPFDYVGAPSAMRYFEDEDNLDKYARLVEDDPMLAKFLEHFDVTTITAEFFRQVQRERRLFYHCMTRAGASFYAGECWHWNWGNENDGALFYQYPYGGSGCHSILKNVRDWDADAEGSFVAVWGNAYAQRRAIEMLK